MTWLIGLNFYIAAGAGLLCAAGWATAAGRLEVQHTQLGGAVALAAGLGALSVYNLGRVAVGRGEPAGESGRRRWIAGRQRAVAALGVASAVACVAVAVIALPARAWAVLGVGGLVAAAYYGRSMWRGESKGHCQAALRRVPGIKPVTVGVAWGVATAVLPAVAAGSAWGTGWVWRLAAVNALLIAGLTIPFDVRDLRHDAERGVATLATAAGPTAATLLAAALVLAAGGLASWSTATLGQPPWHSLRAWAALVIAAAVLTARPGRPDAFYSVGLDGLVFAWAAATWGDAAP